MATIRLYLDARSTKSPDIPAPIKIAVAHRGSTAYIPTGVSVEPTYWDDKAHKVIKRRDATQLNSLIAMQYTEAQRALYDMQARRIPLGRTAKELRDSLRAHLIPDTDASPEVTLGAYFGRIADLKSSRTRDIYRYTLGRLRAYSSDVDTLPLSDIDRYWILDFERWLISTGVRTNTVSIHLRNIRSVINEALDEEIITAYPFRRLSIKTAPTPKRSLTVEQLRAYIDAPATATERRAMDYFLIIFGLIGINTIDLYGLMEVVAGRVEYVRSKTKRLYSIRVEPEVQTLIDRHRGTNKLLDIADTYASADDWRRRLNKTLQQIGDTHQVAGRGAPLAHEPLHPQLTTYWARHTWATIAASLDIPKETIAAALGHGGNSVTDIYIDFDRSKVDKANRRVLDYVFKVGEFQQGKR